MTPIEELNSKFTYKKDRFDKWSVLTGDVVFGDCEDYALTLIWYECGKSFAIMFFAILFMRYTIWYCKYGGNGHVVLKKNGMYADNIQRKWVAELDENYDLKAPVSSIFLLYIILIKRF